MPTAVFTRGAVAFFKCARDREAGLVELLFTVGKFQPTRFYALSNRGAAVRKSPLIRKTEALQSALYAMADTMPAVGSHEKQSA